MQNLKSASLVKPLGNQVNHEFNRYMTKMGIQHNTSTPLWPQGNAEVEAFMKPLGKAIRTAILEGRPWKQELSKFLLAYRSTPIRPQRYHLLSCYITEKFVENCPHFPTTAKSSTDIEKPSKMTKNKSKGFQTLDGIHEQVNYELEIVFW